jgi:tetratricopeptide (TPR) repeat protein
MFEDPIGRDLLGAAAGMGIDEVGRDDAIQTLLKLSLVNHIHGRFELLPLTRTFAQQHMQDSPALSERLRSTWLAAMRTVAAGYQRPTAEWRDNAQLVDIGPYLRTAYNWAVLRGDPSDACTFGRALLFYLEVVGQWDELLHLADDLDALARAISDTACTLICGWFRVWIHGQRGEFTRATAVLGQIEPLATTPGDRFQYLQCHAQVSRWSDDFSSAAVLLDAADRAAQELGDEDAGRAHANVIFERGKLARDQGDWHQAKRWFSEAGRYFDAQVATEALNSGRTPNFDVERALGILGNLGLIEHRLGNLTTAHELLNRAAQIMRERGSVGELATLLQRLAHVELDLGARSDASVHLNEARTIAERLGMARELAECATLGTRLAAGSDPLPNE